MKKAILLLLILLPALLMYGQPGTTCAPVKNGKICYSDKVSVGNCSQEEIFTLLNKWAAKAYGTDIFFSNVSANKGRGSILISSKIELLLNQTDKTFMKFRMRINCQDNGYTVDITDITYQYDPYNEKRVKTYPAENVILNEGKNNSVKIITNPLLFCEATHDFAEKQMGEIFDAIKK